MGRTQNHVASSKYVWALPFHVSNLSNTNGTLLTQNTDIQTYWMARRASIVGISGSLSAALTTGTLTFKPVIDGSVSRDIMQLHTNQQVKHNAFVADTQHLIIAPGQSLGLRYFSSDTVSATTTDIVVLLEVLVEDINF